MRRILHILALACILLAIAAMPGFAQPPPPPHAFWGEVRWDGQLAPLSTKIEAKGVNVQTNPFNPWTIAVAGWYGSADGSGQNLLVYGQASPVPAGTLLRFYVDGVRAELQEQIGDTPGSWNLTYPYTSGKTTRLNLRLVSPVLRISKLDSTTAQLSWDAMLATPEVTVSYELYRSSTEPYFEPPNAVDVPDYPKTITDLSFDDTAAAGNHFYLLKTLYSDDAVGRGMSSNRVGKFDFSLTPGS